MFFPCKDMSHALYYYHDANPVGSKGEINDNIRVRS